MPYKEKTKAKIYNKNYYEDKKNNSLCTKCGKENHNKHSTCDDCLLYARNLTRAKIEEKRKNGVCDKCGKLPPENPAFRCRICLDYHRKRNCKIRDAVFKAYGGYKCNCCGENNKWFL